jgi:hypothetical protein
MPDCRIFQFPTTRVRTNSQNEANNRMGSCIVIVSYKWAGWVLADHTYTDSIGLLLGRLQDMQHERILSHNEWWNWPSNTPHTHQQLPTSPGDTTLCQAQNTQRVCTQPHAEAYCKKILADYFVVLTGDLNDSHGIYSLNVTLVVSLKRCDKTKKKKTKTSM